MSTKVVNLARIRKEQKCSQTKIAEILGRGQGFVSSVEAGTRCLSDEDVEALSNFFGVDYNVAEYLVDRGDLIRSATERKYGTSAQFASYVSGGVTQIAGENKSEENTNLAQALEEISELRKIVAKSQEQIDSLIALLANK